MEDRVKERLTGAAILVVLVVVLVPELFRGERSDALVARATRDGAPPLRSYTIELGNAPQLTAPAPTNATPEPLPATDAAAEAKPTLVAPPAPAPGNLEPLRVGVTTREPETKPNDPIKSGWVVQLGSFSRRENASKMIQQAAKQGVALSVSGPDDRGLFRVRTGVQSDRRAAVALQTRLKAQGYKGAGLSKIGEP